MTTTDIYTVKTALRPDYYELFPLLRGEEIERRLDFLPFHRATLLSPTNIETLVERRGDAEWISYGALPASTRSEMLADVLMHVGITREVARVVADGREILFEGEPERAFLNTSCRIDSSTVLTDAGLVALMCELALQLCPTPRRVVELGVGSGYHASVLARLVDDLELLGTEVNDAVGDLAASVLRHFGVEDRVRVVRPEDVAGALGSIDLIFATFAVSTESLSQLLSQMVPGRAVLVPRQLFVHEFEREPLDSWLRAHFGSYDGYLGSDDWNNYLCLDAGVVDDDGGLRSVQRWYDVHFVHAGGAVI